MTLSSTRGFEHQVRVYQVLVFSRFFGFGFVGFDFKGSGFWVPDPALVGTLQKYMQLPKLLRKHHTEFATTLSTCFSPYFDSELNNYLIKARKN